MKLRQRAAALAVVAALIPSSHVAATGLPAGLGGGDVNQAIAVNTEDGASLFRMAFSIKRVADGVIDQENAAVALASCTDCRTVALAFQVVLVMGGADVVVPTNQAVAYNNQCAECLTFASATQIVVGIDGPVRLTGEGIKQLLELQRRLRDLEARIAELSAADLVAEVSAIEAALITILDTQLVPVGSGNDDDQDQTADPTATSQPPGTTTTTTSVGGATTTTTTSVTTTDPDGSTTTHAPSTSRPSTTTPPTSTSTLPEETPTTTLSTSSTTTSTIDENTASSTEP